MVPDASSRPELDAGADAASASRDAATAIDGDTSGAVDGGTPLTGECADVYRTALVCSGFENAPGDLWVAATQNGTVATQTMRVHAGARALRAATTAGGALAFVHRTFPVQHAELWGRLYLYVPGAVVISDLNYMGLENDGSAVRGLDFSLNTSGSYEVYSSESGSFAGSRTVFVPRDRWVCVQWYVRVSDVGGQVQVIVDGEPQVDARALDTRPGGGLDHINVGLEWTHPAQAAAELFVDDLVLDTAPVPCQ